ncbi:MAG: anaerobic ribonucleoside-triphosphate reductase activating protein [Candidatus Wallbacteria bacterium HGW-Wallbacteria-1]|jgi:pyruvate formate lyase activating enzyme|uniref:Anaerobic ribonucleoside-triphosphate reductase activating protein n=1 Tax=Candidatus Wallbacteria bacterium HGW-Wallbacteria-1 TaxID=2013854 RepID=A0A2N1PV56_9BACT|nr:MAG: anaerobic ribonucleoside-triphosphate reductase activating protein [Candidatus Wallbacteria bacterium HGW-Wallbacteria-1]
MTYTSDSFKFKGFQGTTLLDFPGRIASILFTGGCNLNCPYCHNRLLIDGSDDIPDLDLHEILSTLNERSCFIDGVVITGGEPTLQPWMADFMLLMLERLPELQIKLDTNGTNPDGLKSLLNSSNLAMVAMDIKTGLSMYPENLGIESENLMESVNILKNWQGEKEFRITCYRPFVTEQSIREIATTLGSGTRILLQKCIGLESLSLTEAEQMAEILKSHGCDADLRGF